MSEPKRIFDPDDPSIPRVNQPIEFGGWALAVSAVCRCAGNRPLQLNIASTPDVTKLFPGVVVACPHCGQGWRLGPNTKVALDVQIVGLPVGGAKTS